MTKVIEPSEIIVDQPTLEEDLVHVSPWNRFLARYFDYAIFSISLLPIIWQFRKILIDSNLFHPFSLLLLLPSKALWIPIEALLISTWGYTPGKFLLGIKLLHHKKKLTFTKSIKRSFLVWVRGIGFGIPFITIITQFMAYLRLYTRMKTSWDEQESVTVIQKAVWLWIIIAIAIFVIVIYWSFDFFKEKIFN